MSRLYRKIKKAGGNPIEALCVEIENLTDQAVRQRAMAKSQTKLPANRGIPDTPRAKKSDTSGSKKEKSKP